MAFMSAMQEGGYGPSLQEIQDHNRRAAAYHAGTVTPYSWSKDMTLREFTKNKVLNEDKPIFVQFSTLKPGEMFYYKDGVSIDNVYMKTAPNSLRDAFLNNAVYLRTGAGYTVEYNTLVAVVEKVSISR